MPGREPVHSSACRERWNSRSASLERPSIRGRSARPYWTIAVTSSSPARRQVFSGAPMRARAPRLAALLEHEAGVLPGAAEGARVITRLRAIRCQPTERQRAVGLIDQDVGIGSQAVDIAAEASRPRLLEHSKRRVEVGEGVLEASWDAGDVGRPGMGGQPQPRRNVPVEDVRHASLEYTTGRARTTSSRALRRGSGASRRGETRRMRAPWTPGARVARHRRGRRSRPAHRGLVAA